MDDLYELIIYVIIFVGMITFAVICAVLYYGAIFWVLLWVLRQFGILQHFGIELLMWVRP